MYCWKCGQEVRDNARFCTNCGAELHRAAPESPAPPPRPAVQPEETVSAASRTYEPAREPVSAAPRAYAPAPAAQSAPKKKNRSWIIAVAIIAGLMIYGLVSQSGEKSSGSSDSSSSKSTDVNELLDSLPAAMEDLVKQHKVYVTDEGDGVRIYEIVFYGSDTHTLTDLTEEYVFDKSCGYTLESVRGAGFESDFPSFTECSYAEDDDYVMFICKMKDLKNVSHLQALVDVGFLSVADGGRVDGPFDADYYMDSVLALGWEEASMLDYSLLDFN